MSISYGPVASKQVKKLLDNTAIISTKSTDHIKCYICETTVTKGLNCLHPSCDMSAHIICLSEMFRKTGEYIPITGDCPKCNQQLLWGDLVRKYRGCYDFYENAHDSTSDGEHF